MSANCSESAVLSHQAPKPNSSRPICLVTVVKALTSSIVFAPGSSAHSAAENPVASDPDMPQDSYLLGRIRSGDQRAMGLLYDRYSRPVYLTALKMLRDPSLAEDVLQEVFMTIWRRPEVISAEATCLKGWITIVSRNRALDILRKRVKFPSCSSEETVLASPYDYELRSEHQIMANQAVMIVNSLHADTRLLLEMAFYRDLTHQQIAEEIGLPLGTVKSRIRKGLLQVRDALTHPCVPDYEKNYALVHASF